MNWVHNFDPCLRQSPWARAARKAIALPFLAVVGACVPSTMNWSPAESPKTVQVDAVRFNHDVMFGRTDATLAPDSRAALTVFLRRNAVSADDDIVIVAPLDGTEGALAKRRAAAVVSALKLSGLDAAVVPVAEGPVTLNVIRYVVTPPSCPDWSKPAERDHGNTPHSNFGCATATNLGAMVARPRDLMQGRDPGAYDGQALARGIIKYREGTVTRAPTLPSIVISNGGDGGGGK